jgi:hypothetical protein
VRRRAEKKIKQVTMDIIMENSAYNDLRIVVFQCLSLTLIVYRDN